MSRRTTVAMLACLAIAMIQFVCPSARAEPTKEELARAEQLYREGNEAVDAGQLQIGYEKYRAAFEFKKSYDIAGNLGAVELALGKPRDAAEHLELSLRLYPVTANPKGREVTEAKLAEAKSKIATVTVRANIADATISVDGRTVERAQIFVDPGQRTFKATREGYRQATQTVSLAAGSTTEVTFELEPLTDTSGPASPHPITGLLVAGYGLGGALVATSIVLGIVAASAASDASTLEDEAGVDCVSDYESCLGAFESWERHRDFANPALWLGIGGGVTLAATLIYHLVAGGSSPSSARSFIAPVVTDRGAGISAGMSW